VAAKEIGSHHNEIARWFRELQHYGFLRQTAAGFLGVEGKGKAPHWRLTELGYMNDAPTREFLSWDGTKFRDGKTKSRAPFPAQGVRESQHSGVRDSQPWDTKTVLEFPHIQSGESVPEMAHIIIKPLVTSSCTATRRDIASESLRATENARAKRAPQSAVASERVPSKKIA
jgi:hypothetical protein